ncbi:MAG: hypothetical protein COU29_00145 [Candidatus Magasanikbacteria bacterium CG10_big_fil_rev_8_21_14_0_10_36_32]|uniref:M23ase beta-sheet core domain-containing protein n=1 Tax=Candidatus Magasanikbacteria bacterium CG10_big_fil_rev_8_21_14_0_10_36_32 TaxID=1974646 RepID=A0A2M6W7L8_9BACT|nr:MAG: hypothetical protein COU29_00145 [Candidatus Magasanikbacteria bacterium CG10_big_fil_rev_8_21_14_0_10_36_32]
MHRKISKIIIFLFFVIFAVVIARPNFVIAQTGEIGGTKEDIDDLNKQISEKKDKIKQLEETMGKYQKNIEQKRVEAVSLKNQLSIIDNKIAKTEVDIKVTKEKIDQAQLEIEALTLTIGEKEKILNRQKAIVSTIVRNIHAEDQKNYMEILLTNDSFADFYNQVKYLENVYTDLGRSVKKMRVAKEDLVDKKTQVASRKKIYEDLKVELDNKRQDYLDNANNKQSLLVKTHSSELQYRTLLESLKKQYQVIEGEVRTYEEQVRVKLAEMDKFNNLGSVGNMSWPVYSRYITSIFHDPDYPYRRVFEHSGIDIRAAQGTPIKAAAAGYVARAKRCSTASCYSYVLLVHTGGVSTLYGHMSGIEVTEDQFVARGDIIGYSGGTPGTVGAGPFVTGPHLHFETRLNGIPVNPMNYLIL